MCNALIRLVLLIIHGRLLHIKNTNSTTVQDRSSLVVLPSVPYTPPDVFYPQSGILNSLQKDSIQAKQICTLAYTDSNNTLHCDWFVNHS
jgi:hypothetical protein